MSSTPSVQPLPWPPEWPRARGRWYLALGWLTLLALVSFGGAALLRGGEFDPAVKYFVLFGLVFAVVVVLGYDSRVRRRRGQVRTAPDLTGRQGTVLPYSWLGFAGALVLTVLMALILGLAAYDLGRSPAVVAPAAAAGVFGAAGLFFLVYPAQVLAGRIVRGRLVLTPDGIEHRSWGFRSRLGWDGVRQVAAVAGDGPRIWVSAFDNRIEHQQRAWLAGRPPREPGVLIEGRMLGVDPVLAYRMLDFYAARPGMRAELGTPAAVRRARSGDFD
ncbi:MULTISPECIES: hypothetical protein [unclassified Crossiella]|uniref:hypothetical protein n=1 Tax=unclassified Crossiella TaxID=2620835 RepID=UPI002000096E|nr:MULTISPECIES: hypothetical protein [unclassified Crossiella]MCK2240228.1 hypothetical protein [Crossiella sp. S99.2]MCK2253320.1 hypothetical protein [Crossiella sp. S99.1]